MRTAELRLKIVSVGFILEGFAKAKLGWGRVGGKE
jgi:hypothetical protein